MSHLPTGGVRVAIAFAVWSLSGAPAGGAGLEELSPRSLADPDGFGLQPLQLLEQKLP